MLYKSSLPSGRSVWWALGLIILLEVKLAFFTCSLLHMVISSQAFKFQLAGKIFCPHFIEVSLSCQELRVRPRSIPAHPNTIGKLGPHT
ncbi:hypothetical protein F4814DRAFT_408198 [Daldinia grandis]|nr:hypothetical protein F4814DRAFT_408198 [Daldinia grandis]